MTDYVIMCARWQEAAFEEGSALLIKWFYCEVRLMAYKISDACISCGACAAGCPVDAISEGEGKFEIDENTCISCGACAAGCPVEAISE